MGKSSLSQGEKVATSQAPRHSVDKPCLAFTHEILYAGPHNLPPNLSPTITLDRVGEIDNPTSSVCYTLMSGGGGRGLGRCFLGENRTFMRHTQRSIYLKEYRASGVRAGTIFPDRLKRTIKRLPLTPKYGTTSMVASNSTTLCHAMVSPGTVIIQAPNSSTNFGHLPRDEIYDSGASTGIGSMSARGTQRTGSSQQ